MNDIDTVKQLIELINLHKIEYIKCGDIEIKKSRFEVPEKPASKPSLDDLLVPGSELPDLSMQELLSFYPLTKKK